MQPYLFLFCKALYSYHPLDKTNFSNYFKKGLLRFSNFNPNFGKKECKLVYKTDKNFVQTIVCEKYFNEKHIPFNNIEKQNEIFLTDHLEYENIQSHTINHNNVENYNNIPSSSLQGLSQTPDGFLYPIISNLFSQSFLSMAKIGVLPGFLLVSSNVKQA